MGLCLPGPRVPPSTVTATQLRNLVKIIMFAKRVVTNLSDVLRRNLSPQSAPACVCFWGCATMLSVSQGCKLPTSLLLYRCVTVGREPSVRSACCSLLRVLSRVARLAFFKSKFQKFGLFHSSLAWKNGVCHVRHKLAFFGLFYGVGMKTHCLAFLKPLTQLLLSAWNYINFSQDKGPLFSATFPFSKIKSGSAV